VHRYDIINNEFVENGAFIPFPIDDHVQAVWRDSLIFSITGWSNTKNVPYVQIYNPHTDQWTIGNSVPDNQYYKAFGASGIINGDTIFYFGGAAMGKHYPIQSVLRKGIINKTNPSEITWSFKILDSVFVGYRTASTMIKNNPHWIGGSSITYNYNGIAYDGSGGVNPNNYDLYLKNNFLKLNKIDGLSMDLRGLANINDSIKIIAGGMENKQRVSNKTYQIEWKN
jgi:hypothetical protein